MKTSLSRPFRAPTIPRRRPGTAAVPAVSRRLPPLPVFIAYGETAAARQALERAKAWMRNRDDAREVQPMLWRFDQLDQPRLAEMALRDALQAAVVVLALGEAGSLSPSVEAWLRALATRRPHIDATLLGLVDGEEWTISVGLSQPAAPARISPEGALRLLTTAEKPAAEQAA